MDHYLSPKGPEVGACIYCGDRDGRLGTEHAVPYGINGPWTLHDASCERCANITSRVEHDVLRSLWPHVRNVLALQSRRKNKRTALLPVVVQRDGVRQTVHVPRTNYPTYLPTPLFPPPGILWTGNPVPGVFTNLNMLHVCGPSFAEASKAYPGAEFVGMHLNFSAEAFARMLAKVGFCAAVSAVGLGAFTNTPIRNIILGTDPHIGHWVGSWWQRPVNTTGGGLHEIRVLLSQPGAHIHAIIRLFAQFGAPEYHVILGPADSTYMASSDWPTTWAENNLILLS